MKRKSRHDRRVKTALIYARQHQDFHLDEIKAVCRIRKGRYEDRVASAVLRDVKDVAPFELWPVYERQGFWTSAPSHEVRVVALFRAAEVGATRMQRNAEVMRRHNSSNPLTKAAGMAAKQARSIKEFFQDDLPDPARTSDHCLRRIDKLLASG